MSILIVKGISRKYLRHAAVYRRYAGYRQPYQNNFDFGLSALIECYNHETHGVAASKNNGYVYGKWCKDISVVQWIEDITKGNSCKAEFYTPKDKWWSEPALKNVIVSYWFPYSYIKDINGVVYNENVRQTMISSSPR